MATPSPSSHAAWVVGWITASLAACSLEPSPLPPFGEALVVVDTDLPVPRVVSRLRIDVYGEDGAILDTRDDVRPDRRDWPVSFSVRATDDTRTRSAYVRLRAYPDGRITAENEPEPRVTVDRVVRLRLEPGRRGRVHVVLHGACAGVPSRVASLADAASCVEGHAVEPVVDAPVEPTLDGTVESVVGSWGSAPCTEASSDDRRACVPGGAFVFGDAFYRPATDVGFDSRPERIVRVSRFTIDRDEVTVGRYRAALGDGFVAPSPATTNDVEGEPGAGPDACTFSTTPRGREGWALSCVAWETARAFCVHEGGDLPTEAQWEYAALAAGRDSKALYPWGDELPACTLAVYGRSNVNDECSLLGLGPAKIVASSDDARRRQDVTVLGVRGLAGGLQEQLRDSYARLDDACWNETGAIDPACELAPPPECVPDPRSEACRLGPGIVHSVRGASWFQAASALRVVDRSNSTRVGRAGDVLTGFRCVYPAP